MPRLFGCLTLLLSLACGGSLPIDGTAYFQALPIQAEPCGPTVALAAPPVSLKVFMHRGEGVNEAMVAKATRMMAAYWQPNGIAFEGEGYPNPEPHTHLLESPGPLPEALQALGNGLKSWKRGGLQMLVVKTLTDPAHPELAGKLALGISAGMDEEVWKAALPQANAALLFVGINDLIAAEPLKAQIAVAHELGHALGLPHHPDPKNLMSSGEFSCLPVITPEQRKALVLPPLVADDDER